MASDFLNYQVQALTKVLMKFIKAIGWSIANITGILPSICTHKINLIKDCNSSVNKQQKLNPLIQEVVKKKIIKRLEAWVIYPISGSSWVIPIQCAPKKSGLTIMKNEKDQLVSTQPMIGWHVCIDYRHLNLWTEKDHFPLPCMDQMLDPLVGKGWYYFLHGYSGHN